MNREQKRQFKKHLSKISTKKEIKQRPTFVDRTDLSIPEGSKVQLNIERITTRKDYSRMRDSYKEFVEKHKDTIFTVEYDPKHTYEPLWVCLAEDPTPIKWLFYIGDLFVVHENRNKEYK